MKVVVIGGCGHIGSYLVPMLVREGYDVVNISRGNRRPYVSDEAWESVEQVKLDRERDGDFSKKIAAMNGDIVVDLINFTPMETRDMVDALKGTGLSHYLFCSSIWVFGPAENNPVREEDRREPIDEYGRLKKECEEYLEKEYCLHQFPYTAVRPGQISGPGWEIINPAGNLDLSIYEDIAAGKEIFLPNMGMDLLHHVHAFDVAQVFYRAATHKDRAVGQSFFAVADESLTCYGYARALYEFFEKEPKISFLSWETWCEHVGSREHIDMTWGHIARSGYFSNEKAKRLLEYKPQFTTWETVKISIQDSVDRGVIRIHS